MKRQKVIFDVETTGLAPEHDEILQFSAINENGKVSLNTYINQHIIQNGMMRNLLIVFLLIWLLTVK